jgi:hypothetical protein
VTAADPGREFGFSVAGLGGATANTWGYRLEPAADGTDVTEFFEMPATLVNRIYWTLGGPARLRTNLDGMRTTLERIKAVVEQKQD